MSIKEKLIIPKKLKKRKDSEESSEEKTNLDKENEDKLYKIKKTIKSLETKHLEINKDILIQKENIKYNTPIIFTYETLSLILIQENIINYINQI